MKRFTLTILSLGLGLAAAILPSGLAGNAPPVTAGLTSSQTDIAGPTGSGEFGRYVLALPNGNIVVTDPYYDAGAATDAGAVYLYNGATATLISTLKGSNNQDHVGSGGVTELANGNYVVLSPDWDRGGTADTGAVTWGSGTTGVSGTVSSSNSLVGTATSDLVGWRVTALANGNYVVASPLWDSGGAANAGAATWGDGDTGITGVVSTTNSLVGSAADDYVGDGVTALSNGNYVVSSSLWDNGTVEDAGAATWGDGTTGITGPVSASNSLVGSTDSDQVGSAGEGPVMAALTNGNYVVASPLWDNGTVGDAGAATWGNGTTGITGVVSTTNSLVGTTAGDQVGSDVTALTNGNYVVLSQPWDSSTVVDAGAATWGNGASGITGAVSASNSLVGTTASDEVGRHVTALSNGNYVVCNPSWDNGTTANVGAATWGNGTTGTTGPVSASNSLVGTTAGDQVGSDVTALTNGNYVVLSQPWDSSTVVDAGAATWGNGASGTVGLVSASNSLVGGTANDLLSSAVTALTNGNYVLQAVYWTGGAAQAGAATWGNGTTGTSGTVSASNSLVGSSFMDDVGDVTALANGNYLALSPTWNGTVNDAGAVTWGNGTTGTTGAVSASNSLVGTTAGDQVGYHAGLSLTNGHCVVWSPNWDNGATTDAGAVTWVNGWLGPRGTITAENSVRGNAALGGHQMVFDYDYTNDQVVVGRPKDNIVTLFKPAEYETFVPLVLKKAT